MTDELASFFAKKASKAKKKGVIRLQEVADQLERSARIQDELDIDETKIESEQAMTKITTNTTTTNNNNNEDSEWLDYDDKPCLPPVIREMDDIDIELEEEEKRNSSEPIKTWNFNNENIDVSLQPVIPQKEKYEPKAAARAKQNPLDLKNEMLFPSLEDAADVEKKLKKEEEETILREIEEKKLKEEKEKQKQQLYQPRSESSKGFNKTPKPVAASDDSNNWRREATTTMTTTNETKVMRQSVVKNPPIAASGDSDNWRRDSEAVTTGQIKTTNVIEQTISTKNVKKDSDNWRGTSESTTIKTVVEATKTTNVVEQPPPVVTKTYVPPHLRKK